MRRTNRIALSYPPPSAVRARPSLTIFAVPRRGLGMTGGRGGEGAAMPRIAWTPEQIAEYERKLAARPHFSRLNHISIPVTDLELAKKFYVEVLGGRLILDG